MSFPGPETLGVFIPIIALCIPIIAIRSKHQQRMAEIKAATMLNGNTNVSPNIAVEIAALRQEVAALRETTTRFDMSFDAALTRLEQRVDHIDAESAVMPAASYGAGYAPAPPMIRQPERHSKDQKISS